MPLEGRGEGVAFRQGSSGSGRLSDSPLGTCCTPLGFSVHVNNHDDLCRKAQGHSVGDTSVIPLPLGVSSSERFALLRVI